MWCDDDTIKPYFTEAGRNITYGNLKRQLQSPCFCGFAEKIKKSQKKLKKVLDICSGIWYSIKAVSQRQAQNRKV